MHVCRRCAVRLWSRRVDCNITVWRLLLQWLHFSIGSGVVFILLIAEWICGIITIYLALYIFWGEWFIKKMVWHVVPSRPVSLQGVDSVQRIHWTPDLKYMHSLQSYNNTFPILWLPTSWTYGPDLPFMEGSTDGDRVWWSFSYDFTVILYSCYPGSLLI